MWDVTRMMPASFSAVLTMVMLVACPARADAQFRLEAENYTQPGILAVAKSLVKACAAELDAATRQWDAAHTQEVAGERGYVAGSLNSELRPLAFYVQGGHRAKIEERVSSARIDTNAVRRPASVCITTAALNMIDHGPKQVVTAPASASPSRPPAPGVAPKPRTVAPPGGAPTQTPANRKDAFFSRASSLIQDGKLEAALPLLEEGVRMGDPRAQYVLAIILSNDGPVPQNIPRALTLMRLAAAQNLPQAVARLPRMEQLAARGPTRNDGGLANPPTNQPATAGMIPEVAEAFRQTKDPAIRARIVRNAAQYANSRPTLLVRANTGTGCVIPELVNFRFNSEGETWIFEYQLRNTCAEQQLVFAEMLSGTQIRSYGLWPSIWTAGFYPVKWDARRDPGVGFKPHNPGGEIIHWRLAHNQTAGAPGQVNAKSGPNQIEVWIGSCNTYAPGHVGQVMFRPTAAMRQDPRIACVPGIQGHFEY